LSAVFGILKEAENKRLATENTEKKIGIKRKKHGFLLSQE
jgi:hypothetical protein